MSDTTLKTGHTASQQMVAPQGYQFPGMPATDHRQHWTAGYWPGPPGWERWGCSWQRCRTRSRQTGRGWWGSWRPGGWWRWQCHTPTYTPSTGLCWRCISDHLANQQQPHQLCSEYLHYVVNGATFFLITKVKNTYDWQDLSWLCVGNFQIIFHILNAVHIWNIIPAIWTLKLFWGQSLIVTRNREESLKYRRPQKAE